MTTLAAQASRARVRSLTELAEETENGSAIPFGRLKSLFLHVGGLDEEQLKLVNALYEDAEAREREYRRIVLTYLEPALARSRLPHGVVLIVLASIECPRLPKVSSCACGIATERAACRCCVIGSSRKMCV